MSGSIDGPPKKGLTMAEETPPTALARLALELIRQLGSPEVFDVGPLPRRPEEGEVLVVGSGAFEVKTFFMEAYVVEGPTIIEALDGFPIHAIEVLRRGEGVFAKKPPPGKEPVIEPPRLFLTYEVTDGETNHILKPRVDMRGEVVLGSVHHDRVVPWQFKLPFLQQTMKIGTQLNLGRSQMRRSAMTLPVAASTLQFLNSLKWPWSFVRHDRSKQRLQRTIHGARFGRS